MPLFDRIRLISVFSAYDETAIARKIEVPPVRLAVVAAHAVVAARVREPGMSLALLVEAPRLVQTSGETEITEPLMADEEIEVPPELSRSLTLEEMLYVIVVAIADNIGVTNRDIQRATRRYLIMKAEDEGHDPDAEGRS